MHFYAPEICLGISDNKVDGRKIDIWSFGVCIFGMTFKKLPFFASCIKDLLDQIAEAKYNLFKFK
jgi:serine/threonine protein kinase